MPLVCSNELAAVEFLEKTRWGGSPCCVYCYCSEFEFRYNARKLNDGERTLLAIQSAEGKWLVYRLQADEAA